MTGAEQEQLRHVAMFRVSAEVLLGALHLPPGTVLRSIRDDYLSNTVEVCVGHPGLPGTPGGKPIPTVDLKLRENLEDGSVEFLGWGQ